jgi:DNA-binding NarL/FixJ family response regulator
MGQLKCCFSIATYQKIPIYNNESAHVSGWVDAPLFPGSVVMVGEGSLISVLIASKTAMVGELFAGALNRHSRFRVVASVTAVQEVLDAAQSVEFDVALISAALADGPLSGFAALRHLRESAPDVKTVLLLDIPEPNLVFDAFRAGAKGIFCPSQSPFKALCRCVERVHAGQIWAKSSELAHVLETFCKLAPMRVVNADGMKLLTKREEDVVRLLGDGLQNREIAHELNLSEHTVKNYLFHIFDKLGVSSRVELILYAVSSTKRVQSVGPESGENQDERVDDAPAA